MGIWEETKREGEMRGKRKPPIKDRGSKTVNIKCGTAGKMVVIVSGESDGVVR